MFKLPSLPYAYEALAPYFDAQTMEVHHTRHHQGYVNKLNAACAEAQHEPSDTSLAGLGKLLAQVSKLPAAYRHHGGGHYNHTLFWRLLSPKGGEATLLQGAFWAALTEQWGGLEGFKKAFSQAAMQRFGSGWAWLVITPAGQLAVGSTPNQDNPCMDLCPLQGYPLLALDVWEHAYYLHYQHRRADYIAHFWHLVDWGQVAERYTLGLAEQQA